MKTISSKAFSSRRSLSKLFHSLRHHLRELAPIIIPGILFSIFIYCCVMETLTFTPSHTFNPKTNLQTIIQNLPAPIISEEKNI